MIRVRAGTGAHRFIGIWFVIVTNRVLARSWSVKPEGWYRKFLKLFPNKYESSSALGFQEKSSGLLGFDSRQ